MSDYDQTVYTGGGTPQPPPQPGTNRNRFLILGGIGCALVLCAVILLGAAVLFGDQIREVAGLGGDTAVPIITEEPTEEAPTDTPVIAEEPTEEAPTGTPAPTEETPTEPAVTGPPVFGVITFALGASDDYEPIDPATSFEEGTTEVHAIFDYSGMSADNTWERVWYLDSQEILRNSAPWTDKERGRFDYFIDAGGDPLSPGEWMLELYVDGELLTKGTFTIEGAAEPVAQVTDTPVPEPEPTDTPTPETTSSSGGTGTGGGVYQLLYTKWDGGQHNLYVADTNGSNEQFIMNRAAGPSWTPNGQTIFFYGEEGVDRQNRDTVPDVTSCEISGVSNGIIAMGVPSPLTDICVSRPNVFQGPGWNDGTARWANVSPDGQMVAYDAMPGGNWRIYFLGTADNQQFRFEVIGEQGDWSPDSQRVVYRSGRDGITGLWISNRDDTGHTNVTSIGSDSFPAWSPDGETIAFSREEGGNVDIYSINVDGSNLQRLTDAAGPDTLPVYTPTGDIIFRSARTGSWGIYKMSVTGPGRPRLFQMPGWGLIGPSAGWTQISKILCGLELIQSVVA